MKKVLLYDEKDNVMLALEPMNEGDLTEDGVRILQNIPIGHKIARKAIQKGEAIIKFDTPIGLAKEDIRPGEHVHVHNVQDTITDWRNNARHEYDPSTVKELPDELILDPLPKLYGYRRPNGMVGFRNHLLLISTVVCANQPLRELGYRYRDLITLENPSGCVMVSNETERINDFLLGLARNPNVGGVIFCGLGCETVDCEWFYEQIKDEKPAAFVRIQTEGSCDKAIEKLDELVRTMQADLDKEERVEVSVGDIRLGTKCGGSDWTTSSVSNPAIGYCSDLIVKNGGVSLQGETNGWFGGENYFIQHARTKETADKLVKFMEIIYDRILATGRHIEEGNPTPGNIEGGITTLNEKALGNVKKGGYAPIEDVLDMGEYPKGKGFYLTNNAGLDPISLIGLTANSANVLLFSTGRGSPVGTPIAPSIKLTGSPNAMAVFSAHTDVDLTDVLTGTSIEEAGMRLFREVVEVCNGKLCIAEKNRNREYAFPLLLPPQ